MDVLMGDVGRKPSDLGYNDDGYDFAIAACEPCVG